MRPPTRSGSRWSARGKSDRRRPRFDQGFAWGDHRGHSPRRELAARASGPLGRSRSLRGRPGPPLRLDHHQRARIAVRRGQAHAHSRGHLGPRRPSPRRPSRALRPLQRAGRGGQREGVARHRGGAGRPRRRRGRRRRPAPSSLRRRHPRRARTQRCPGRPVRSDARGDRPSPSRPSQPGGRDVYPSAPGRPHRLGGLFGDRDREDPRGRRRATDARRSEGRRRAGQQARHHAARAHRAAQVGQRARRGTGHRSSYVEPLGIEEPAPVVEDGDPTDLIDPAVPEESAVVPPPVDVETPTMSWDQTSDSAVPVGAGSNGKAQR